jgi:uncharacterized SAM-binding protein YcdF (DUF218 family)
LAPSEEGKAEVVILEGVQVVSEGGIATGIELIFNRQTARLIVVIHRTPRKEEPFALPLNYAQLVKKELEARGLKKDQFLVISVPVIHPITLNEAKFVLAELEKLKVRSAILLSEGFHTRRSIGVYRQEGAKLGMHIIPRPYYISYQPNNWWLITDGVRTFVTEYLKLGYYLLRGYLSLKNAF